MNLEEVKKLTDEMEEQKPALRCMILAKTTSRDEHDSEE